MKRQAIITTPKELRDIANLIEKGLIAQLKKLNLPIKRNLINKQNIQVNIINKNPECSDTWRFEIKDDIFPYPKG